MAAPATPYSTSAQVGLLLKTMFLGANPSATSPVTTEDFTQLISWVDSVIDSFFRSVGYKVPFVAMSGETWPTSQTVVLSYMSSIGAAAMAGGHILNPAPAMVPIRSGGGDQHPYTIAIDKSLQHVLDHGYHFRAQFYLGTKAEKWISEPQGPWTDFMVDRVDPTRYQMVRGYTDMIADVFDEYEAMDIDWDYMWSLKDSKFDVA